MNLKEFSDGFDTLVGSYIADVVQGKENNSISFDEYEKSLFLTEAQEELLLSYYNNDIIRQSFEATEEMRRYLDTLVETYATTRQVSNMKAISSNSYFYDLPQDLWFIVYEAVNFEDNALGCKSSKYITVTPVTHDEYHRVKYNPFRGANERRVLRLDAGDNLVEIISKYNISEYLVRYLAHPTPIILIDLPDNLSIEGFNSKMECALDESLHRVILENAVRKALVYRTSINKQ